VRRSLALVTPPTSEPVGLSEFKAWAKVDADDDDPLITSLLTAARQAAEEYTRRAFVTQTWRLALDAGACGFDLPEGVYDLPVSALTGPLPSAIELPRQPIQSVSGVVTSDTENAGSVYAPSNYTLIGSRLVLNASAFWPGNLRPLGSIEITYVAGHGIASAVPQAIRTAILMHAQAMYDGRTVCDLPSSCETLLRNYRVLTL
jgi:hypothetical protein